MYESRKRWSRGIVSLLMAITMIVGLAPAKPARAEDDVPIWARDTGEQAGPVFEAQADLPASFDLRQAFPGNVNPVKCQSPYSTCWAFGGIAAAETSIAADFKMPVDLSERHLVWFALHPVTDLDAPPSQAGEGLYVFGEGPETNRNAAFIASNPILATSLFSTGVGPVLEEDFPYRGKTGMTTYEYYLGHKDEWCADARKRLIDDYIDDDDDDEDEDDEDTEVEKDEANAEEKLLKKIQETTDFTTVEDYINSLYQKTIDGLKDGSMVNSYSEKDDWTIDPVDENGESNRNVFAGYTIRDGNLLPSPITKDAQGVVSLNEAGMQAMKQELMRGRAVSVCICADQSAPNQAGEARYTNKNTWAAYVYDNRSSNHQVAIVGWDDNYAVSNFNQGVDGDGLSKAPPAAGAWIVRNSWGRKDGVETKHSEEYGDQVLGKNDWGVDGSGYFYVSYYDKTLSNPETMTFGMDLAGREFHTYAYDYLPAYDYFLILEGKGDNVLSSANVFTAASDEKITSVSTRTDEVNSRVTFAIYLLTDESKDPTDGTLVEKFTRTYGYAGFHRADLENPIRLKEGERFSVVSTVSYVNGDGVTVYETVANKAISQELAEPLRGTPGQRNQYGKAVVNRGESYIYEGGAWKDWADKREETNVKTNAFGCVIDNFSIKAYALPLSGATYACTEGDGATWTKGASEGLTFAFEETTTYGRPRFIRATLDDGDVDPAACVVGDADVRVTLPADLLSGLSEGTHTLVAHFEDGDPVTVTFTVAAAEQPGEDDPGDDKPSATYACTEGDGATWTKGTSEGLAFAFEETTKHGRPSFSCATLDDGDVDPATCVVGDDHMTVTLSADLLSGLSEGTHTLVAHFEDGDPVTVTFTVAAAGQPGEDEPGDDKPAEEDDKPIDEPSDNTGANPGNTDNKPSGNTGTNSGNNAGNSSSGSSGNSGSSSGRSPVSRSSSNPVRSSSSSSSGSSGSSTLARTGDGMSPGTAILTLGSALVLLTSGLALRRRREGQ